MRSPCNFLGFVVLVTVTIAVAPACKDEAIRACENGLQGALLAKALGADDSGEFNEALGEHGPVQAAELPCLVDAATSWSSKKRRFAAVLMTLVRSDDPAIVRAAQIRIATETDDPVVWATLVRDLLDAPEVAEEAQGAVGRPEMIEKAMAFTEDDDPELEGAVQAAGLRAGLHAKVEGIDAELSRRLDARDDTLLVALDALPPETARAELPRLLQMLEAYESGTKFPGSTHAFFTAVVRALVRTGDPTAHERARAALAKDYTEPGTSSGSRDELMTFRNTVVFEPEPAMREFLLAVIRDEHVVAPLAFAVLTTQVYAAPKALPSIELVTTCVALLEPGFDASRSIRYYEQIECAHLLSFMATGVNPRGDGPEVTTEESLAKARDWLETCRTSTTCAR
jgi:hypothetical protein